MSQLCKDCIHKFSLKETLWYFLKKSCSNKTIFNFFYKYLFHSCLVNLLIKIFRNKMNRKKIILWNSFVFDRNDKKIQTLKMIIFSSILLVDLPRWNLRVISLVLKMDAFTETIRINIKPNILIRKIRR